MLNNFFSYIILLIFTVVFHLKIYAYKFNFKIENKVKNDSLEIFIPKWDDYNFSKNYLSTQIFDSTFTLKKTLQYNNFLQKDLFGKISFSNIGVPLNKLIFFVPKQHINMIPSGKSENLVPIESVRYFNVKTPTTEFIYHNGIRKGQSLKTTFTYNIHPRWNYALAYHGLNSLGEFINELAINNSILISSNYRTKNNFYRIQGHYLITNINNQENGGIAKLENLLYNNYFFTRKHLLKVYLLNAKTKFYNRRFFIEQFFRILNIKNNDSLDIEYPIQLRNVTFYENMKFNFLHFSPSTIFNSELIENFPKNNTKKLDKFSNFSSLQVKWKNFFLINTGIKLENINFYTNQNYIDNNAFINLNNISDKRIGFIGKLEFYFNSKTNFLTKMEFSNGSYFKKEISLNSYLEYHLIENDCIFSSKFNFFSFLPNLNLISNESFYSRYNYLLNFENEQIKELSICFLSKKYKTQIEFDKFIIKNFSFLNEKGKSEQAANLFSIIQFHLNNEINYEKISLNTQITYQKFNKLLSFFSLPTFITRIILYYQSFIFNKKAICQSGIRGYYFSEFNSQVFNPVVNEFQVQNSLGSIGKYLTMDMFFNLKVKNLEIFMEMQNLNSFFYKNFRVDPLRTSFDIRLNLGIYWLIFN